MDTTYAFLGIVASLLILMVGAIAIYAGWGVGNKVAWIKRAEMYATGSALVAVAAVLFVNTVYQWLM